MESVTRILRDIVRAGRTGFKSADEVKSFSKSIERRLDAIPRSVDADVQAVKRITSVAIAKGGVEVADGSFRLVFRSAAAGGGGKVFEPDAFVKALRSGDLKELDSLVDLKSLGVNGVSGGRLQNYLRATYPDHAVRRYADRLSRSSRLPKAQRDLVPSNAEHLGRLAKEDVRVSRFFEEIERVVRKRGRGRPLVSKGLYLTIAIAAPSTAAIVYGLDEASRRAEGCWRTYTKSGQLASCKSNNATCTDRANDPSSAVCRVLPAVHTPDLCTGAVGGQKCLKCDSRAPVGSPEHISPEEAVSPNDVYECRGRASLGDMFGQLVVTVPELAGDLFEDAKGVLSNVWNGAQGLIAFGVIGAVILLVFYMILSRSRAEEKSLSSPVLFAEPPPPYSETVVSDVAPKL